MRRPVQSYVSQVCIFARQQHLQEILERQPAIIVRIKETHKRIQFLLSYMINLVVSQEVKKLK